jgi:RND family efflux transporter MFP subunit
MQKSLTIICCGALLLLGGCGKKTEEVKAAATPEAVEVRTALAEARTVEKSIMVTGSLHPDEETTVSSEVGGRVKSILVDFGQPVRRGQVVVQLDTTELSLQLERTKAALAQAMARLGLEPGAAEEPESTAGMRQAKAQLEDARARFARSRKLVESGDISRERFEEAQRAMEAREAAYDAMRDEMRTQLASLRALRAEVALAEKRVKDATVVAPFDGAVGVKHVSPGQYVKENVPLLTIVKTSPLRLRVEVPESAVSEVRVGTELKFATEAAPGQEFSAIVRELNPSLDARSRTLTAEARLTGPDARLKPGSFVQVRLITAKAAPVIALPSAAVYTVAGLNKFFTIEEGKAVERRIPEVLGSNGWVEIPEGTVPPGSVVAVSNLPLLTNGAAVKVTGGRS